MNHQLLAFISIILAGSKVCTNCMLLSSGRSKYNIISVTKKVNRLAYILDCKIYIGMDSSDLATYIPG